MRILARAAIKRTLLSSLEPLLDILLRVPVNSPDCITEGSMPKYAASFLGFVKVEKSPTSAIIVAAVIRPIPDALETPGH